MMFYNILIQHDETTTTNSGLGNEVGMLLPPLQPSIKGILKIL